MGKVVLSPRKAQHDVAVMVQGVGREGADKRFSSVQ